MMSVSQRIRRIGNGPRYIRTLPIAAPCCEATKATEYIRERRIGNKYFDARKVRNLLEV
jgi:hypothetical protein